MTHYHNTKIKMDLWCYLKKKQFTFLNLKMFFKVFIESIRYFYIMCYIPLPLFQLGFSSVIKI